MTHSKLNANLLQQWCDRQWITAFDRQFALHMADLEPQADDLYLFLCVLGSHQLANQHTCLILDSVDPTLYGLTWSQASFQSRCQNLSHLYQSIGVPGQETPWILDSGKLYLMRYHQYEQQLSSLVLDFCQKEAAYALEPTLLNHLFPCQSPNIDWQKVAAMTALQQSFTVITGGPGTGKTTTVAKILCLLCQQDPHLMIRLVAPTGKAAARLSESIKHSKTRLCAEHPQWQDLFNAIPEESQTIHRLLGLQAHQKPKHHAQRLLDLDLLLIDEASMIDLPLMVKLLQAVPAHARVIVLGDPEQLASVEAGCILANLCAPLKNQHGQWQMQYTPERVALLETHCAADFSEHQAANASSLGNALCVLTHSHRFAANSGIGCLAKAINLGDVTQLRSLYRSAYHPDLEWFEAHTHEHEFVATCTQAYSPYLHSDLTPEQALAAFQKFRILCATHEGTCGVAFWNRALERALAQKNLLAPHTEFYLGRPILILQNDYSLGLFNGDIGLILKSRHDQKPRAYFVNQQGKLVTYMPAQLPKHQTCFAMTIHKSQGSEFDTVATILPESPVLQQNSFITRELVYTAITRAKHKHLMRSGLPLLIQAAQQPTRRASGLEAKLWQHRSHSN
jgi:exodeoxyribonuclease V alpha subunit